MEQPNKPLNHLKFLNHIKTDHLPTELTFGSECSGIEAPYQALSLLGINVKHLFACEIDTHACKSIEANYSPVTMYKDITTRDPAVLPHVDLYVAGFPCQSFSVIGTCKGFDSASGTIFFNCLQTIQSTRPKCFILENVKGLTTHDKGNTFATVMACLNELSDYYIHHSVYNTKHYGLPQNRERVYIVGMSKEYFNEGFTKPNVIPLETSLWDIVDRDNTTESVLTPHKQRVLDEFVSDGLRGCKVDPSEPWMLNLNASSVNEYLSPMNGLCSCLLANGSEKYFTPLKRYLTAREVIRLQGFPDTFKQVVSDRQFKKQAGNSMSTNVLCAIISSIYLNCKG